MASQVQIPFEGVILQEHSAPISCPTPNFAKGSRDKNFATVANNTPNTEFASELPELLELLGMKDNVDEVKGLTRISHQGAPSAVCSRKSLEWRQSRD